MRKLLQKLCNWDQRPKVLSEHPVTTSEEAVHFSEWICSMHIDDVWKFARQMDKAEQKDPLMISSCSVLKRYHAYAVCSSLFEIDDITVSALQKNDPAFACALMRAFMCVGVPGGACQIDGADESLNGRWRLGHGNEVFITNYCVNQNTGQLIITVNAETSETHALDGVARWILVVSPAENNARFFVLGAGSHPMMGIDVANVVMSKKFWETVASFGFDAMHVLAHSREINWQNHAQEIIHSKEFAEKFKGTFRRSFLSVADWFAAPTRKIRGWMINGARNNE